MQNLMQILQQGYQLHQLQPGSSFNRTFETYKEIPLIFLISGNVEVKCINLEGDTETIKQIKSKGLVTVEQTLLAKKYGSENPNLLTKFQIIANQDSILLEILGSNRLQQIIKRKQITQKQNNIMRRFMIFPSKEVVRVTVNSWNHENIKDRIYLLSGKACYYLDDQKQFGRKLILSCYEEGYLNPKQFFNQIESNSSNSKSSNTQQNAKEQQNQPKIKLYIFQQSEVMYLQQNFLKDDYIKAIQLKKKEHLKLVLEKYKKIQDNFQVVQSAQNQLIIKFKLNKKQISSQIFKILQPKRQKGVMTAKETNDRKQKTKTDLTSTSSSIKCSIRIRKSKKIM